MPVTLNRPSSAETHPLDPVEEIHATSPGRQPPTTEFCSTNVCQVGAREMCLQHTFSDGPLLQTVQLDRDLVRCCLVLATDIDTSAAAQQAPRGIGEEREQICELSRDELLLELGRDGQTDARKLLVGCCRRGRAAAHEGRSSAGCPGIEAERCRMEVLDR